MWIEEGQCQVVHAVLTQVRTTLSAWIDHQVGIGVKRLTGERTMGDRIARQVNDSANRATAFDIFFKKAQWRDVRRTFLKALIHMSQYVAHALYVPGRLPAAAGPEGIALGRVREYKLIRGQLRESRTPEIETKLTENRQRRSDTVLNCQLSQYVLLNIVLKLHLDYTAKLFVVQPVKEGLITLLSCCLSQR